MDVVVTKKTRVVSEQTKNKLRSNLEKARKARSVKAAAVRDIKEANLERIIELATAFKNYLNVTAVKTASGDIKREACLVCESNYVPGGNICPCQGGWSLISRVEEYLKNARE